MESLQASEVGVVGCTDQCEGWLEFRWPDRLMGWECLRIDFDGFCSRRMSGSRSGVGLRDLDLGRDRARLWFTAELADKLGLPTALKVRFVISDEAFAELQRGVDCMGWPSSPSRPDAEPGATPDHGGD